MALDPIKREIYRHDYIRGRLISDFPEIDAETLRRLERTLEKAGVIFIPEDERFGPGVRLRDRPDQA